MITILMATYNGEKYLKEQLASIKNQTYKKWRLIVRDDNSNDDTIKILEKFAEAVPQEVLIKENNQPSGCAKNNFARLMCDAGDAEYIMFADQDDIWKEYKLEKTLNKMKQLEKRNGKYIPLLVHGDVEIIDKNGNIIANSMFRLSHIPKVQALSRLIIQNNVTGCTMMINALLLREIVKVVGNERVIMHDYFAALYAETFGKIGVIDAPLLSYRQHESNSVGAKDNNNIKYLLARISMGKNDYKAAMSTSRNQISFFLDTYGKKMKAQKKREYKLMKEYLNSAGYNHAKRIFFYYKYDVWKNGLIRKIMQCIWG